MNWRPEKDWINPYLPPDPDLNRGDSPELEEGDLHDVYEAGADAILEAQKKNGLHITVIEAGGGNPPFIRDDAGQGHLFWSSWGIGLGITKKGSGWLLFIPGEE